MLPPNGWLQSPSTAPAPLRGSDRAGGPLVPPAGYKRNLKTWFSFRRIKNFSWFSKKLRNVPCELSLSRTQLIRSHACVSNSTTATFFSALPGEGISTNVAVLPGIINESASARVRNSWALK